MRRIADDPATERLAHSDGPGEPEETTRALLLGLSETLTLVGEGAPLIAIALRRAAAELPPAPPWPAEAASLQQSPASGPAPTPGDDPALARESTPAPALARNAPEGTPALAPARDARERRPERAHAGAFVISVEAASQMRDALAGRVRAVEVDEPGAAGAALSVTRGAERRHTRGRLGAAREPAGDDRRLKRWMPTEVRLTPGTADGGHVCRREPKYDFSAPRPSIETALTVMGHAALGGLSDQPGSSREPGAHALPTSPAAGLASTTPPATTISGDEPKATAIRTSLGDPPVGRALVTPGTQAEESTQECGAEAIEHVKNAPHEPVGLDPLRSEQPHDKRAYRVLIRRDRSLTWQLVAAIKNIKAEKRQTQLDAALGALVRANQAPPAPTRRAATVPEGIPVYVTVEDVMASVPCAKTAAYDHMRRAAFAPTGTRGARPTVEQWASYDPATKSTKSEERIEWESEARRATAVSGNASPVASGTRPSGSTTSTKAGSPFGDGSNDRRKSGTKGMPAPFVPRGSMKPLIPVRLPRKPSR
jgi:hypothetical protein